MTVFSAERQSAEVLVARERAPAWASEDMYGGDPALSAKVALHAVSNQYLQSIYSIDIWSLTPQAWVHSSDQTKPQCVPRPVNLVVLPDGGRIEVQGSKGHS